MDIFQISANSADAKPGKGTGEALISSPSTYSALAAIPHWRRKIASGDTSPLPLTGNAELWEFTPGKAKTRRMDWEAMRSVVSDVRSDATKGNLPKEAVEMDAKDKHLTKAKKAAATEEVVEGAAAEAVVAPKLSAKEKLAAKKAEIKARKEASATAGLAAAAPIVVAPLPESSFAADVGEPVSLRVPEAEDKQHTVRFCPTCNYYLYLNESSTGDEVNLFRLCHNCGYKEMDSKGGLVSEILVQETSTESYKILLNEYTRRDPRLPHIRGVMKCPNETCQSNVSGVESDIIYMKYDGVNLMYLYICDVCGYKWHSRR